MQPPILDVWRDLGGGRLVRHTSPRHGVWYSGRAFWRNGDSPEAVSIRPERNRFYDFRDGKGGDSLGLVAHAKGISLQEAGRYLVREYGDRPDPGVHKAVIDPREAETARSWRLGMLDYAEDALRELKAPISHGRDPEPGAAEKIRQWTRYRERIAAVDPENDQRALVREYRLHMKKQPEWAHYLAEEGANLEWAVKLAAVSAVAAEPAATRRSAEPASALLQVQQGEQCSVAVDHSPGM